MQYLITTFDEGNVDWSIQSELLKCEAKHILEFYQNGAIRNIWFSEKRDAILIIESESKEKVQTMLNDFPLVKAKLIRYQIVTLLPYTGFERLVNGTDKHN